MMVKEHPCVTKAAPRFLALAAAVVVLFLWIPAARAAAAEQQQRIIVGNTTTSLCNVDGNAAKGGGEEEDGGCLGLPIIAHAQPQLEGLDMASNLGSSAAAGNNPISYVTLPTRNLGNAACGRDKFGRYFSCTTDPFKGNLRKCDPYNRECY